MAPHSSTLAWKIPQMEEPGRLQVAESDMTERLHFHFSLSCIGEGNGSPLQGSCLENPRDGGAWWTAVYGVAQSRTGLKRLRSSSSSKRQCVCPKSYPDLQLSPSCPFTSSNSLTFLNTWEKRLKRRVSCRCLSQEVKIFLNKWVNGKKKL